MTAILVLRTVDLGGRGSPNSRFVWPVSGPVEASRRPGGRYYLRGYPWGVADTASHLLSDLRLDRGEDRIFQLVAVERRDVVESDGSVVRFTRGEVVFSGERDGALALLAERAPAGTPIPWTTRTVGDGKRGVVGHFGCAVAGECGTAIAGDYGTARVGKDGIASAGVGGTLVFDVAGDQRTVKIGERGTLPRVGYWWWKTSGGPEIARRL